MNTAILLVPMLGLGVGTAAAYGMQQRQREQERRLHFVERDELDDELTEFGIDVSHNEVCAECGRDIEPGDVGALVEDDGHYRPICNDSVCLNTYDLN